MSELQGCGLPIRGAKGQSNGLTRHFQSLPARRAHDARRGASLAIDEIAMEQAERLGAVKFIDKMELAKELVPTLLQFAPSNKPS